MQARNSACDSGTIQFLNRLMTQHMQTLAAYAGQTARHPEGPQSGVMWTHLALKTLHVIKLVSASTLQETHPFNREADGHFARLQWSLHMQLHVHHLHAGAIGTS